MSCFCCIGYKTHEEIYTTGLQRLHASNDPKTFIAALKILKKAADKGHKGACYQFGNAVWDANLPLYVEAIGKAFHDRLTDVERFSFGERPFLLDHRQALAQKYLLIALNDNYPGSLHKIEVIVEYANGELRKVEQSGKIDLSPIRYQKF